MRTGDLFRSRQFCFANDRVAASVGQRIGSGGALCKCEIVLPAHIVGTESLRAIQQAQAQAIALAEEWNADAGKTPEQAKEDHYKAFCAACDELAGKTPGEATAQAVKVLAVDPKDTV